MDSTYSKGCFTVSGKNRTAAVATDRNDFPGVARAAKDLTEDIRRVTGRLSGYSDDPGFLRGESIVAGTIGKSRFIDSMISEKKIDVSAVRGNRESYLIQVVPDAMPGMRKALVVAGSDRRGTIYGIYRLSKAMGVSPWYWWADVPARRTDELYVKPVRIVTGPPSVKYRGIFLNDEYPALTNWVYEKFGTAKRSADPPVPGNVANYGREFYSRIFELILRLGGNCLWPAMWNNAFNEDDPENPRLADEYGIVMGTSHQEPMLRAQKEWDRRYQASHGSWNYAKHAEVLENFWRDGIRRNGGRESIVTLGLRGADDTEMAPGGPGANMRLLERIIDVQRNILSEALKTDPAGLPQLWCLYKEVQEYYRAGMRVPDDVILLWAEDNWGNVRRLPTAEERKRPGGAGIYYHFDYHGGPRSYQWMNTSPIPKIWDQMSLARRYGADTIWIVNAGHLKGYEFAIEYFLDLARDADDPSNSNATAYARLWAERQFGPDHAEEIADLMLKYTKYNGRRKPELLSPETYSLVNYREAERIAEEYRDVAARAERLYRLLPEEAKDAFYQLVLFPAAACSIVNALYVEAGKNALYAKQGRASAALAARNVRELFKADLDLMTHYNTEFAGGKWAHFMDQTHLGYVSWRDPPVNSLDAIPLVENEVPEPASLGVSAEGSECSRSEGTAVLPPVDSLNRQRRWIDVFNGGRTPFTATFTADVPWLILSAGDAVLGADVRIEVEVDWDRVPEGRNPGSVTVRGAGSSVSVSIEAFNPETPTRSTLQGFAEGDGHVSVEAGHFSRNFPSGETRWTLIEDYGRTHSGMRAETPVDAPPSVPGVTSARIEYDMYLFTTGNVTVSAVLSPTLNFLDGRPLRYAVSFDDGTPVTVVAVPEDYDAANGNRDWERTAADNARICSTEHGIFRPGYHTLKLWTVDPGVVVQKIIVDTGGLRPSYLGPPESFGGIG